MIKWRLIYADGSKLDEPADGGSILESWPDAVELHLVQDANAVTRIILDGWQPIFYRQRSLKASTAMLKSSIGLGNGIFSSPSDRLTQSDARLDATVFGRARDNGETVDSQLWACLDGQIVPCPKRFIAAGAITHQLQSHAVV